jgi:predicted SAM-dependent methyltransferase
MSNYQKVLRFIEKSMLGLEIGASYQPVTAKRDGWQVEVADHVDAESLRKKYSAWNVDVSKIEDVDYILDARGLFPAINQEEKFDFIIASHVIEHVPDPISFLVDCGRLLKNDGILSLVVPDKRYCFDVLKSLSTTGDLLQAFLELRTRHTAGTIFDAYALHCKNENAIVWNVDTKASDFSFVHTISEAYDLMKSYINSDNYVDVHAWVYTPASFNLILSDLAIMGLIPFEVACFYDTSDYEFHVSLKKCNNPTSKTVSERMGLAKNAVVGHLLNSPSNINIYNYVKGYFSRGAKKLRLD